MVDDRINVGGEPAEQVSVARSGLVTALAVLVLAVAVIVVFVSDADDESVTGVPMPFLAGEASGMGENWWRDVIAGNTQAALAISHPDAGFDFVRLSAAAPSGDSAVAVAVDSTPFGSEDRPQLCYILLAAGEQYTGSFVFREADGVWLVVDVVPDAVNCVVSAPPG